MKKIILFILAFTNITVLSADSLDEKKEIEKGPAFTALDYLALPVWKRDHEVWGWSEDIMVQLLNTQSIEESTRKEIKQVISLTESIVANSKDFKAVELAMDAHSALNAMVVLGSVELINGLPKYWVQSAKEDPDLFLHNVELGILGSLRDPLWGLNRSVDHAFDVAYHGLVEDSQTLFVIDGDNAPQEIPYNIAKKIEALFLDSDNDPLNRSDIFYDIYGSLVEKGFVESDHTYWMLTQLYPVLSESDQRIVRVIIKAGSEEAITDFAENLTFFSGIPDFGWSPNIQKTRAKVLYALATTIVLKGPNSFLGIQEVSTKLAEITQKAQIRTKS